MIKSLIMNSSRRRVAKALKVAAAGALLLGTSACGQTVDAAPPPEVGTPNTEPSASATTAGIETTPIEAPTEIVVTPSPSPEQPAGNLPSFEGATVDASCAGADWSAPVGTKGKTLEEWVSGFVASIKYEQSRGVYGEGPVYLTCDGAGVLSINFPNDLGERVSIESLFAA